MVVTLEEMIASLPEDEQLAIRERAQQLIAEEMSLRELRAAREMTQEKVAGLLGIGQDSVSRLEKRTDLMLSTLRDYVAAMGGSLELVAQFPDRPPIRLSGLGDLADTPAPAPTRPRKQRTG